MTAPRRGQKHRSVRGDAVMAARAAAVMFAFASSGLASCANAGTSGSMDCSAYNTVDSKADQYIENTNAVSDLLLAHGIDPSGNHHYNASAGDNVMNVTVASGEVAKYCQNNPGSTIDKGIEWSNFKKQ